MTLADYDVAIILANGDERRVITVRVPAEGQDLAAAAGYDIASAITRGSKYQWRLAAGLNPEPVQVAPAAPPPGVSDRVHLPPRFGPMAAEIGEVLAVGDDGVAEVEIRRYGTFYVLAIELRPCAPRDEGS